MLARLEMPLLFFVVCIVAGGCDSSHTSPTESASSDSQNHAVPASVTNDAELMIYRCGKPDVDDETTFDDPRPPIPTRMLTYRKAHLRIAYFANAPLGDPPPYKWKVVGMVDTRNDKAISKALMESTLQQRLPCSLNKAK